MYLAIDTYSQPSVLYFYSIVERARIESSEIWTPAENGGIEEEGDGIREKNRGIMVNFPEMENYPTRQKCHHLNTTRDLPPLLFPLPSYN